MLDTLALVSGLPADPHPVLDLLSRSWPEPEAALQRQALAEALTGPARDNCLCVRALIGGSLAGVVLAQQLPGRTAAVYPPQTTSAAPAAVAARLLAALEDELHAAGVVLAQALLSLEQVEDEARLHAAGYTTAATLLYMACAVTATPPPRREAELLLEPVTPRGEPRLRSVIESTYQGTLDCPLLNGLRTSEDVLAGYRGVGTYRPELWLTASSGGRDVGCLLLADHPEVGNLEIVYVGVVPEARGQDYGLTLVRHAQSLACQAGRERIVLAVDAANAPAIRLYERAGFFGFDQRLVLIKSLATGATS